MVWVGLAAKKTDGNFKKKFKKKKHQKADIDEKLRGKGLHLHRRIAFVQAKRAENGDIMPQNGTVAGTPGKAGTIVKTEQKGKKQEEVFTEVEEPLYPRIRLKRILNWQRVSKIGPGLRNVGNTCFCNSVLQCLAYTPPLATFCLSGEHSKRVANNKSGKFDALAAMERHITTVFSSSQPHIKPATIINALRLIGPRFRLGRQEDAHEFARLLMEGMHVSDLTAFKYTGSAYARAAQTGVIHGMFGGYLRSQVHCESCSFNSNTYDAFLDL